MAANEAHPILRWARNTLRFYGLLLGRHRDSVRRLASGRPPVLLLCGWGGTRHTMALLEERLDRDGFAPYVFPLGGALRRFNTRGVDALAVKLERHLQSLEMGMPGLRVAVVGHSMGGLIGRYLVAKLGGSRFVHTLVTLGTPHRGSPMATAAGYTPLARYSPAIAQLTPGSAFLADLAEQPLPPETSCAALFSSEDHYCPPPAAEFDIPPGADHMMNVEVGPVGHVELVIDEGVYELIRNELLRGLDRAGKARPVTGRSARR